MRLYELTNEYELMGIELEDCDEISEDIIDKIRDIEGEIQCKAINIARVLENWRVEENAIEKAIFNMKERLDKLYDKREKLEKYLQENMEKSAISYIGCPEFIIRLKKCPPSVRILDASAISERYKSKKEIVTVNKMKIKEELQSGMTVSGAELVQNNRLEIK